MRDFTEQVLNEDIKKRLFYALDRNKPFQNFKYEVDYDEEVWQQWFQYKDSRYREYVEDCIRNVNIDEEE